MTRPSWSMTAVGLSVCIAVSLAACSKSTSPTPPSGGLNTSETALVGHWVTAYPAGTDSFHTTVVLNSDTTFAETDSLLVPGFPTTVEGATGTWTASPTMLVQRTTALTGDTLLQLVVGVDSTRYALTGSTLRIFSSRDSTYLDYRRP